jgi:hypothetical protein
VDLWWLDVLPQLLTVQMPLDEMEQRRRQHGGVRNMPPLRLKEGIWRGKSSTIACSLEECVWMMIARKDIHAVC